MEATLDQPSARLRPLVEAACAGDRDAFRMLVEPYVGRALGAATIITRSPADAADAVQDALLSAWRGLPQLRDPEAFPAWFRQHVVRAAIRATKSRGRVTELDLETPDDSDGLDRAVAPSGTVASLIACIVTSSPRGGGAPDRRSEVAAPRATAPIDQPQRSPPVAPRTPAHSPPSPRPVPSPR